MKAVRILWVVFTLSCGVVYGQECDPWQAKLVSTQGTIEYKLQEDSDWQTAKLGNTYCSGTVIRSLANSRAALELVNQTIIRLDAHSTLTLSNIKQDENALIKLIKGAIHFITRIPRSLKVDTPYVNAAVEGTEFLVRVEEGQSQVLVYEGTVLASNEKGQLRLNNGQSAIAKQDEAPTTHIVVKPRDGVQWSLYYPPVIELDKDKIITEGLKHAISAYEQGDLSRAFKILAEVEPNEASREFYLFRASLYLTVGRVKEAQLDLEKIEKKDPEFLALKSIIATSNGDKKRALDLSKQATRLDKKSATALIALSYAHQAQFNIKLALSDSQLAVKQSPKNSLAWARLSELQLANAQVNAAIKSAKKAIELGQNNSRPLTILGFAYLHQYDASKARKAFQQAIEMDSTLPLSRLGLGLAKIKSNRIKEGRRDIEIAASLDPGSSIVRAYLAKAYYTENRDNLAADQFTLAKSLDPNDPTPWFYSGLRTDIHPTTAIKELENAIDLNNNNSVKRSSLRLDADLSSRSSELAKPYQVLGFNRAALANVYRALAINPLDPNAHLLLSNTYGLLPKHELASISEFKQAQLYHPSLKTPLRPVLGNLSILNFSNDASFFNNSSVELFDINRSHFSNSSIVGSNGLFANEFYTSATHDRLAYSFGQFHHSLDGFRENFDLNQNIVASNFEYNLTNKLSLIAEYQESKLDSGDLRLHFVPNRFSDTKRQTRDFRTSNFTLKYHMSNSNKFFAYFKNGKNIQHDESTIFIPAFSVFEKRPLDTSIEGEHYELQYANINEHYKSIHGISFLDETKSVSSVSDFFDASNNFLGSFPNFPANTQRVKYNSAYSYHYFSFNKSLFTTAGISYDKFSSDTLDHEQINHKAGITWLPSKSTTFRVAWFRDLKQPILAEKTIEPTHISGFNQFYDLDDRTDTKRIGVGLDYKPLSSLFVGIEGSDSDFVRYIFSNTGTSQTNKLSQKNYVAYINWILHPNHSLSINYSEDIFNREYILGTSTNSFNPVYINTKTVPLTYNFITRRSNIKIVINYVDQWVAYNSNAVALEKHKDKFFTLDLFYKYQTSKKSSFNIGIKNALDQYFYYQNLDGINFDTPTVSPFLQKQQFFTSIIFNF